MQCSENTDEFGRQLLRLSLCSLFDFGLSLLTFDTNHDATATALLTLIVARVSLFKFTNVVFVMRLFRPLSPGSRVIMG